MSEPSVEQKDAEIAAAVEQNMKRRGTKVRRNHGLELQKSIGMAYERSVRAMEPSARKSIAESMRPLAYSTARVVSFGAGVADAFLGIGLMLSGVDSAGVRGVGGIARLIGGGAVLNVRPVTEGLRIAATAAGYGGEKVANITDAILGKGKREVLKVAA